MGPTIHLVTFEDVDGNGRYSAAIEEKFEPIFEESQELLVRFAPQGAAFV